MKIPVPGKKGAGIFFVTFEPNESLIGHYRTRLLCYINQQDNSDWFY